MTAFAIVFAMPMAKWLGLSGSLLGLLGAQLLFQSIVAVALFQRSSRVARETALAPRSPVVAK
jgi:hypothetical protein